MRHSVLINCVSFLEAKRDSVIAVYIEQGEDAKCGRKDVNAMRSTITMTSYEDDELWREGNEYEKSRFLHVYKNDPEIIKKAKWFTRRVRNESGQWVIEQHTKVYERPKGEYKFREVTGKRVAQNTCLDDGQLQFAEDQQQRVLDDTVSVALEHRGQGLIQDDIQPKDQQQDVPAMIKQILKEHGVGGSSSASGKKEQGKDDKDKKLKDATGEDDDDTSSDEEDAPVNRIMQSLHTTPRKAKGKAKASPLGSSPKGDISAAATSAVGSSGDFTDRTVTQLLNEVEQALNTVKNTKAINDMPEELLKSLSSRLQTKKNQLCRKASKKGGDALTMMDAISKARTKVSSVVEAFGAISAFEKKRTVKTAQAVDEKFDQLKASGAFAFMPACIAARSLHADLHIKNSESKNHEAIELCKISTISGRCPMATPADAAVIQSDLSSRLLSQEIRQNAENKELASIAKAKLLSMLNNILPLVTDVDVDDEGKKVLKATVVVFNDKAYTYAEVLDALSLIEKLSKHNELCKVLLNLTPFDEIFLEVKNRIRESEKVGTFVKSIEAVKDSDKAQALQALNDASDPRDWASIALGFVEAYGLAFKSMPEVNASDLPSFEPVFADIINSCLPLYKMVSSNLALFETQLLEVMKDVGAETAPDQAELAELSQFLGSMTICRTSLLAMVEQISALTKMVNCQASDVLKDWVHMARKGKCMEALVNAAAELQRYLLGGKLMVDGNRMARASVLSTCACSTLLELGQCAGEADKVIFAICSSFSRFLCRCVCFVLCRVLCFVCFVSFFYAADVC